jgi:hypothetical protein
MTTSALELDSLADLRLNYLKRLRSRVESLNDFVAVWTPGGDASAEVFADNHRIVDSMISSSAIFGYIELSKEARVTERAFAQTSTFDFSTLCPSSNVARRS